MTKSELINADFLAESEMLAVAVLAAEELHIERVAAIRRYQELVTLKSRLATIDVDIGRACCRVVAVERELKKAEQDYERASRALLRNGA